MQKSGIIFNKLTLPIFLSFLFCFFYASIKTIKATEPNYNDSIQKAINLIRKAKPNEGIVTLMNLFKKTNLNKDTADFLQIYLSEAYRQKREYRKGVELLNNLLAEKDITPINKAFALNRLAALYTECGNMFHSAKDSAIKYSKICIEFSENNGLKEYLASSQNELGYLYRLRENPEAVKYIKKSYENFKELKLYTNAVNSAINLAGAYFAAKKYKKAINVVDSAMLLIKKEDNKSLFFRLYLRKSDILGAQGNYKEAYYYMNQARVMQVHDLEAQIERNISEMVAKYDLKLKQQQISTAKHKYKVENQQKIFLLFFSLALILVIIVIFLNIRLKKKVRLQKEILIKQENAELKSTLDYKEKQLEFKNKELSQAIANIISFNKILSNIKKELKNNDNKAALREINLRLSSNKNWEQFLLSFNEVYPYFFGNLAKEFPDLTENETKLCAFLLMKLKTREIADISNISEASVSKNRNRLRKKLNLETAADISDFLEKFA